MNIEELMSVEELMEYLPDHPAKNTVYAWVTRGKIPYTKLGKKLFFSKTEINEWNENDREITTTISTVLDNTVEGEETDTQELEPVQDREDSISED